MMIDYIVVSSDLWPYVRDTRVKRGEHHLKMNSIRRQGRLLDNVENPENMFQPSPLEQIFLHPGDVEDTKSEWTVFKASIAKEAVKRCGSPSS